MNKQPYKAREQFAPQARSTRILSKKKRRDKNNKSIIALIHQSNLAKDRINMFAFDKRLYMYDCIKEKMIFPVSTFTGCVKQKSPTIIIVYLYFADNKNLWGQNLIKFDV